MKKILLLLAVVFTVFFVNAQSTANYTFSNNTTGSLTDMSSGTTQIIAPNVDVNNGFVPTSTNPIGFDFIFMGVVQTVFTVNENGVLRFGTSLTTMGNVPILNIAEARLIPFACDMQTVAITGSVRYKTTGTVGSRILTVEWSNMELDFATTGGTNTFQIRLYETTNVIEYAYGTMNVATFTAANYGAIGFTTGTTDNRLIYLTSVSSPAVNRTVAGIVTNLVTATGNITGLNSAADGNRTVFTFTPPIASNAPTTLTTSSVFATAMNLNWIDNSVNETGFLIYRSTDNINFTLIATTLPDVITYQATGLSLSTTYYWRVAAINEGAISTAATVTQATTATTLTGTFLVGPTGTYTTITLAATDLANKGLVGSVILELQSTYVSIGETFPINLTAFAGLSASNTLTIRPVLGATALSVLSAAGTQTFNINGGQYITIDGRPGGLGTVKQLTIANELASGNAIQFINEASNNSLRYLTITGVNTSTTSGVIVFGTTTGTNGNDNNTIDNCLIKDGSATPTNLVYAFGTPTTPATFNSNITITNNEFANFFNAGTVSIGIFSSTNNTDWTITGNSFYQTVDRTFTVAAAGFIGISVSSLLSNNHTISTNTIGGKAANAGGGAWTQLGAVTHTFIGIRLAVGTTTPSSIQGNIIRNISITTTSISSINAGISVVTGSANIGTSVANTIGDMAATGNITYSTTGAAGAFSGILMGSGTPGALNVQNNNVGGINITTSASGTVTFRGIWLQAVTSPPAALAPIISNNTIGGNIANSISNSTNLPSYGINSSSTLAFLNPTIEGNVIRNINSTSIGASVLTHGINMAGAGAHTIRLNVITNLSSASTNASVQLIGIMVANAATTGNIISRNTIHTLKHTNAGSGTTHHVYGINYNGATMGTNIISRNTIHSLSLATTGSADLTQIRGMDFPGVTSCNVENNIIRLGLDETGAAITGNYFIHGISKQSTGNINVYHNSVYIGGVGVGAGSRKTGAFRRSATGVDDIRNNIFVNARSNGTGTGRHYAIDLTLPTTVTSNYNILNATGTGFALATIDAGTTSLTTLNTYRVALPGQELNSAFGDPNFVLPTGTSSTVSLKVQNPTPAEANGILIASVTDDFEGELRSSFTPTDIGADAGSYTTVDIFAPTITYTALASPNYGTTNTQISATIADVTGVLSTGTLQPRIYFRKGAGSYFSTQGTRTSGTDNNGVWLFTIDHAVLGGVAVADVIQYYIIAQDNATIPNLVSNPVNATATDVNTVTIAPTTPNSYTIAAGISWVGTTSTNWSDASNWSPATVPTASDNVSIATASGNMPEVGTGVAAVATAITNSSTLTVSGTGSLAVTSITNSGTINANGGTITTTTTITNNAGGNINVAGGSIATTTSLTNNGTITATSGTLTTTTSIANNATINVAGGTITNTTILNNSGTITITSGILNVTASSGAGITNTVNSNFNINGGTFNLGPQNNTANNRTFSHAGGTLNVSSGTMNIAGVFNVSAGIFTQSGGNINVDFNGTASATTAAISFSASSIYNLSGGTITIVDPGATSIDAFNYSATANTICTGTHTVRFGDGVSTTPGFSSIVGFTLTNVNTTPRFHFRNLTINGTNLGANRFVTQPTDNSVLGTLTVTSGSEYRQSTNSTHIAGNMVIDGVFVADASSDQLAFEDFSSGVIAPVTIAQTVTGSGTIQNAATAPTGEITILRVNNTNPSGVTISMANPLRVTGAITITNGILNTTGLTLNGGSAQTVTLTAATSSINVTNLTLNNSLGATLGGLGFLNVTGTYTPTLGILTAGGRLTLKSSSGSTARIAAGATGTYISGNINVERFIPAKASRRFSFITSPVSQALSAAWQQQIHITGAGTGGTPCPSLTAHSNGFDATTTNAPNMFSYNASAASGSRWTANTTGTTGFTLTPGTGYRLNVRGARSIGCSLLDGTAGGLIPTAVTLSATGAISNAQKNIGSFNITYNNNLANNWVLMGNPYPSEIDFTLFRADAANAGANAGVINASYIIYDPANAPDNVTPANMYSTWNAGVWSNAATSISGANGQYIASGQAFFVQAINNTNITLNFAEAYKYAGTQNGVFRTALTWNDIIRIALNKDAIVIDQTVVRYANEPGLSNNRLGDLDATLLSSSNSYLGTIKAGNLTSIQTRSLQQVQSDSVQLDFNCSQTGNYSFNFSEHNNFTAANIYLLDKYTKTTTEVKANPVYSFSVDKANAATQTNRFVLVFNKAIVPVVTTITGIKMYPNPANKNLTIELPITEGKYTVRITDVTGKQVYQNQLAGGVQAINIGKLAQGNYVVETTDTKGNRAVEKLVKQ